MPIDPEAIKRFLERPVPLLPKFKGEDPRKLHRLIYNSTGQYFRPKTEPKQLQLEGTAFALWLRRSLMFYWMRAGKTKLALDWAEHLQRSKLSRKKGLVIPHGPVGAEVWEYQAEKHSNLKLRVIKRGSPKADFIDALEDDSDLVAVPWPMMISLFTDKRLSRKKKPKLYPDIESLEIASEFFTHAIIDETQFCMDWGSLRFALGVEILRHCKFRLGMTGTPIGRDPFALWAQAFLIDEGVTLGRNYKFFEAAFGSTSKTPFTPSGEQTTFDRRKRKLLYAKMSGISLSYSKEEVETAETLANVVELRMAPTQKKAYNEAVDKLVKLSNIDVEIQAVFIRLRQIASGYLPFVDNDGNERLVNFPGNIKIGWLKELIEQMKDTGTQGVVFHEFIHSGELICKAMAECGVKHAWLYGQTKNKKAEREKFERGEVQWLVANTKTGGTGVDLAMADYLCFFESPVSPIIRAQAQARPMARGDRALVLDDLVCAPVEQKILDFIEEGQDMLRELTKGGRGKLKVALWAK